MDDSFVPAHRGIPFAIGSGGPHPGSAVNPGPLYRLPWYPVFSFVTAGTSLGIAQGAVRDFAAADPRARRRPIPARRSPISRPCRCGSPKPRRWSMPPRPCCSRIATRRWAVAASGNASALVDRARWRRDGAYAAQLCARAVDIVFAGAGGGAIHEAHPLQRALRDIHAANGHIGVSWDLNGGIYGRVALGLAARLPALTRAQTPSPYRILTVAGANGLRYFRAADCGPFGRRQEQSTFGRAGQIRKRENRHDASRILDHSVRRRACRGAHRARCRSARGAGAHQGPVAHHRLSLGRRPRRRDHHDQDEAAELRPAAGARRA